MQNLAFISMHRRQCNTDGCNFKRIVSYIRESNLYMLGFFLINIINKYIGDFFKSI